MLEYSCGYDGEWKSKDETLDLLLFVKKFMRDIEF
jgi:hypothetical protein